MEAIQSAHTVTVGLAVSVSAGLWNTTPGCTKSGTQAIPLPEKWQEAVTKKSICGSVQKAIHHTRLPATRGVQETLAALCAVLRNQGELVILYFL